jgi:hypothetical protein
MKYLITYIIGLVFGILISAILILYFTEIKNIFLTNSLSNKNITEHFKDNDNIYEERLLNILDIDDQKDIDYKNVIYNESSKDKYNINKFLKTPELIFLISSYQDSIQENIEGLKWKIDNKSNYINDIIVTKEPRKNRYIYNSLAYGYNLNDISVQFNNNYNSLINNFGILFTLKINEIEDSNILIINNDNYNDTISINIKKQQISNKNNNEIINIANNYGIIDDKSIDNDNIEEYNLNAYGNIYDIEILINTRKYYINNISEYILKEDYVFLGLIIDKTTVYFHINDTIYDFRRLDNSNIYVDSPFYINENKSCNIILYSSALLINDLNIKKNIEKYKIYNNYNLNNKMNI